jgi:DNA-binding NtrC family response regulator
MTAKKKVIILDDEPIVGDRLKSALEKSGFEVETYVRSQDVIDRITREKFDVLVTDLKMRKPDGLDVMKYVKEHSPSTRVIIITGFATVETATVAMKSGAVDFVAKPFKIRQMRDLILKITSEGDGLPDRGD